MNGHQVVHTSPHQSSWYGGPPSSNALPFGAYGGDPYGYRTMGYAYQPSAFSSLCSTGTNTSGAYNNYITYTPHWQRGVNNPIYVSGGELGGDIYQFSPSSSERDGKQREDVYDTSCEEIMSPLTEMQQVEGKDELEPLLKFSSPTKMSSPVYEHNMFDKMPIDEIVCEKNVLEEVCKENNELKMKLDAQMEESNGLRAKLVESERREKEIEVGARKLRDVYNALVEKFNDRESMLQSIVREKGMVEKSVLESNKVILELQGQIDGVVREKEWIEVERKEEVKKSSELQYTVNALNGRVLNLQREEEKLREDLVEFEKKCLEGLLKEAKMKKMITELVNGNNEKESIVDSLIAEKCYIQKELHKAVKQLDEEKKKIEQTITEKNALVEAKVRRETELAELRKQLAEFRNALSELEMSCKGEEVKVKMLESEVGHYKAAYEQVALEKDEILRCFADEKQNGINMKNHIKEMEKHFQEIIKEVEGTKVYDLNVVGEKKELETLCRAVNKGSAFVKSALSEAQKEISWGIAWDNVEGGDEVCSSVMASQWQLGTSLLHTSLPENQLYSTLNLSPKRALNGLEMKALIPLKSWSNASCTSKRTQKGKLVKWFHVATKISFKEAIEVVADAQCFDMFVNFKKLEAAKVYEFSIMFTYCVTSEGVGVISVFEATLQLEECWKESLVVLPMLHIAYEWIVVCVQNPIEHDNNNSWVQSFQQPGVKCWPPKYETAQFQFGSIRQGGGKLAEYIDGYTISPGDTDQLQATATELYCYDGTEIRYDSMQLEYIYLCHCFRCGEVANLNVPQWLTLFLNYSKVSLFAQPRFSAIYLLKDQKFHQSSHTINAYGGSRVELIEKKLEIPTCLLTGVGKNYLDVKGQVTVKKNAAVYYLDDIFIHSKYVVTMQQGEHDEPLWKASGRFEYEFNLRVVEHYLGSLGVQGRCDQHLVKMEEDVTKFSFEPGTIILKELRDIAHSYGDIGLRIILT